MSTSSATSTTNTTNGLISGMDIDSIISKTMAIARLPEDNLKAEKATLQTQLTAWQSANTSILSLNSAASTLSQASTYNANTFVCSDTSVLSGSATSDAQTGTYFITVNSLARSQQLSSQGYADTSKSIVGTGSLNIQVGTGTAVKVTIDSSNDTLSGLRDAINKANAGVTASIVNDGSSTNPYHLVVTSNTGGTGGEMTFTSNLSGGTSPTLTELQPAKDASVTLGQGAGALTITGDSNSMTGLIPGVTLDLKNTDIGQSVTVNIAANTANVGTYIANFIDAYNNTMDFMNTQFSYDSTSGTAGTLFADPTLEAMQTDLTTAVTAQVAGLPQSQSLLSQIGITIDNSYHLVLDATALQNALSNGTDVVQKLFSNTGDASNSYVTYASSSSKTKASGSDGYAVNITQVATQTRVTAGDAQTSALAADETLTINGKQISLTAGMSQAEVVKEINNHTSDTGVTVSATQADGTGTGNYLSFASVTYGSSQKISIQSNLSNGGSSSPTTDTTGIGNVQATQTIPFGEAGNGTSTIGQDVQGTINGEAATGSGQLLTGKSGNTNTDGLVLKITASSLNGNASLSLGKVTYTKGIASTVTDYTSSVTATSTGMVAVAENTLQSQMDYIDTEVSDMEDQLTAKQDYITTQYANMESMLGTLKSQGQYITAMFSSYFKSSDSSSSSSSS